jgi:trehalose 6-phosphate phosphatase
MRNDFLTGARRPILEELAASRLLLAFDYDGVLAPLGTAPDGRAMRPATRRLLGEVARRYPVAVISGRAYRDLDRLVPTTGVIRVGNHGFELGRPTAVPRAVLAQVAGWEREIRRRLAGMAGWYLEQKRSTLSIHYGIGRNWRRAERAVHEVGAALEGARLVPGKKVLNVLPAAFPHKGDAVRRILRRLRLDTALFLGDDVTDEDVFLVGPPQVVGVRVGPGRSAARFRLSGQASVDELLGRLLALRDPPMTRRRTRP